MMPVMVHGPMQEAVEAKALALIAALGAPDTTKEALLTFASARKAAEEAMAALELAKKDIEAAQASLSSREQVCSEREQNLAVQERNYKKRTEDFENNANQRTAVLEDRAKAITKERKDLNADKKRFDADSVKAAEELNAREDAIKKKEAEVQQNLEATAKARSEAEDLRNKAASKLAKIAELGKED